MTPLKDPKAQKAIRSLCGGLGYAAVSARADLSCPVSCVVTGQSNGTDRHLQQAVEILKYVNSTADREHFYICQKQTPGVDPQQQILDLPCFWDSDLGTHKPRTGVALLIAGGLTLWGSWLQQQIRTNTAEAELAAGSRAARELMGISNVVMEVFNMKTRPILKGDNQASILMAKGSCNLRKVRHVVLADLYLRSLHRDGLVEIEWVSTLDNIADMCTKVLPEQKLLPLLEKAGIRDV